MSRRDAIMEGVALVAAAFLAVTSGNATTLLRMGLGDLTANADVIALVQAGGASVQTDPANERLYTFRDVNVSQVIKGDAYLTNLTVKTPGGELGSVKMEVPAAPVLEENGTYVLFLYQGRDYYDSNVVGWEQGVFEVEKGTVLRTGQTVDEFVKDVVDLMNASGR